MDFVFSSFAKVVVLKNDRLDQSLLYQSALARKRWTLPIAWVSCCRYILYRHVKEAVISCVYCYEMQYYL